jgi:MFS family permease
VVSGAAVLAFSASQIYWLGLICAVVAGGAMTVSGAGTQTLMQNAVEGTVRGRVMSLYGLIFRGAPALGALLLGILSGIIGLQPALAIGGAFSVLIGVLYWRLRRAAGRTLERETLAR